MQTRRRMALTTAAFTGCAAVVITAATSSFGAQPTTDPGGCQHFHVPGNDAASLRAAASSARSAGCGLERTTVDFDDGIELAVPKSGSWVVGHFDRISPLPSLDVGVYRTHGDHLVAVKGETWTGTDGDVAEAKAAMTDAGSIAPTAGSTLSTAETQKLLDTKRKAQQAERLSIGAAGSTTGKCSTAASYVLKPPYLKSQTAAGMWEIDWYYNPAGQPTSMNPDNVRARVNDAPDNWEYNHNTCGMTNWPNLTTIKMGTTSVVPNQTDAACLTAPSVNVIGWHYWGTASGVLADTCVWGTSNNGIFAMAVNGSFNFRAAASIAGCSGSNVDLEGTLTHEWGHALGLDHISTYHQVMNPYAGTCDDSDRYLGRGDFKGVKAIYGVF